jgi:hypothetical protein
MKRLARDEKGQALVLVLVLLLIGVLIVTPTLNFMGTGVKSGRVYEQKDDEIYAADSGVEDALWHVRNDLIGDVLGAGYNEYDYSTAYPYLYKLLVNGKNVTVTMQNVWIPKDIATPSPSAANKTITEEKLLIIGYPGSSPSTYVIKIVYDWGTNTTMRDALKVKEIGIWLSPGFQYNGGCTLTGYSSQNISLYKGGQAVVWNFASQPRLTDFLPATGPTSPMVKTFSFLYTGPEGQIPELVSSWIDTTGVTGITCSWDDSIRLYKIVSQAGGIQVEAYGAKTKFRKLKSTISADYAVAGNTLLKTTGTTAEDKKYRDKLYAESSSTLLRIPLQSINSSGIVPAGYIPEEAIIDSVYLYWSGWIDYHYYQSASPYTWREIAGLKDDGSVPEAQLIANSKVDRVKFAVGGSAQTITDDTWQIARMDDSQYVTNSWMYSCKKDVTDLVVSGNVTVKEYIENAMKTAGSGTVTFTLGHADAVRNVHRPESSPYPGAYANYYFALDGDGSTGYPLATPAHKRPSEGWQTRYQWAYAGWSLIIFYRSPALIQRQLYLYDELRYRSYLGGGIDPTFPISGFLAPPVISENDKSHLTYFVGEGDGHYPGDSIKVNTYYMSDANNPQNNVFNSYSNALLVPNTDGEDVDTFVLPQGCILPYDTQATITLITDQEIYTLVYIVLSFRSELTTGGIITNYAIKII